MMTQIQLSGANCPTCFETVRTMLSDDPGVVTVHGSFSGQCIQIELGDMCVDELMSLLQRNLHGVGIAGNGDRVMVDIEPSIGDGHCHR
ncbi:MAG: hypothetical protein ABJC79_05535 [Acidimicrobiia bacterium]